MHQSGRGIDQVAILCRNRAGEIIESRILYVSFSHIKLLSLSLVGYNATIFSISSQPKLAVVLYSDTSGGVCRVRGNNGTI